MFPLSTMIVSVILYIVFAPAAGGLLAGIDRKISARMQRRVGPPVLQPFYDVAKLIRKEAVTVNRVQDFYVLGFLIFIIAAGVFFFAGSDLLLVIFTLTLAGVFLVVAAYSSNSPYAEIGAERELLQMMAYEPMILLTATGFYLACGSFNVADIIGGKLPPVFLIPGMFIGYVYILTIKFRKSPFDLSMSHHAHQELVRGLTTEFSGRTLALIEIGHWYENIFLLGFVYLFFSFKSGFSPVIAAAVCLAAYFLEVLIDNCFARMKWQIAINSSWIIALTFGFINLILLYLIVD